jgi:hypothetical protein
LYFGGGFTYFFEESPDFLEAFSFSLEAFSFSLEAFSFSLAFSLAALSLAA